MGISRRQMLGLAGRALAAIPLVAIAPRAGAAVNAAARAQLKYQDHPSGNMSCASCLEFLPGKTPTGPGGCRKIPGDDEISPNGYCTAWNTL